MTKTKLNLFSVLISFLMLAGFCMVFCACNIQDGRTVYTNLTLKYAQFVEDTPEMFQGGQLDVQYSQKLTDVMFMDNNFAKLKSDALFEPVLCAAMEGVNYYISKVDLDKAKVPQKDAENVYKNFEDFKDKVDEFLSAKHNIESRDTINPASPVEQSLLEILCTKYQNLINSGITFGKNYLNLYQNAIFKDYKRNEGERYAVGKMRLTYLQLLNEFAGVEVNDRVSYYINKPYTNILQESICKPLLQSYAVVMGYSLWEGSGETITTAENSCINTFTYLLNYQTLYKQALSDYQLSLSKIELSKYYNHLAGTYQETDFTTEERVYFAKIDSYYNTYAENTVNYMQQLCSYVYNFKHA